MKIIASPFTWNNMFAYVFIFQSTFILFSITHCLFSWFSCLAVITVLLLYLYIWNVLPGACGDYALHVGHGLCLRPLWMCSGLWVSLWTLRLLSQYFKKCVSLKVCVWSQTLRLKVCVWSQTLRLKVCVWSQTLRLKVCVWSQTLRLKVCVFVDCVGFSDVFSIQRNAGLLCKSAM